MFSDKQIQPIAQQLYETRVKNNIKGNADCDWFLAETILNVCKRNKIVDIQEYMKNRDAYYSTYEGGQYGRSKD